ncbi:MAG: beta/gamma crystallin-related protein [Sterolibacterium sp.]
MNWKLKSALGASALVLATQAMAQITFYEGEGFRGRAFTTEKQVNNFQTNGFNDRASSVIVDGGRWEVCEDVRYKGHCVVLRTGNYDSLVGMGMNNRISSVRPADNRKRYREAPEPMPTASYDYRRRPNERVFEANVTSVRAVMGPPEQRCWVEHQQVADPARNNPNVGGAIAGALIGGVLGHQVGGGRGQDLATAGGAVAGGLIGSKAGQSSGGTTTRDVRRCEDVTGSTPAYWDVTYDYRGVQHQVQMSAPPGRTIAVNENGEPRQ